MAVPIQRRPLAQVRRDVAWGRADREFRETNRIPWTAADAEDLNVLEDELIDGELAEQAKR